MGNERGGKGEGEGQGIWGKAGWRKGEGIRRMGERTSGKGRDKGDGGRNNGKGSGKDDQTSQRNKGNERGGRDKGNRKSMTLGWRKEKGISRTREGIRAMGEGKGERDKGEGEYGGWKKWNEEGSL